MPILTRAELEARIGANDIALMASRDEAGDVEDFGAVQAAIDDAEQEVLGYVRMATQAPVPDPAPPILKRLVAVIARYNLMRREVNEDHPFYIAYRDAVRELKDIASGKIALPFGSEQTNAASAGVGVAYAPPRVMTDTALQGMFPIGL